MHYVTQTNPVDPRVLHTMQRKQYEQRTPEWYAIRQDLITASSAAQALTMEESVVRPFIDQFGMQGSVKISPRKCCAYKGTVKDIILDKCGLGEKFTGNEYTRWGQKYEPIASTIYSQMRQRDVIEVGLIVHEDFPFIGASPDGLTNDGILLEIKCPAVRGLYGYPPLHYFIQILLQLECSSMQECDYLDCKFVEYVHEGDFVEDARYWEESNPDATHHIYGICMMHEVVDGDEESEKEYTYTYAPVHIRRIDDFLAWADAQQGQRVYYKLNEHHICRVQADKAWFDAVQPKLAEVWKQITYHRTINGMKELTDALAIKEEARLARRAEKATCDKKDGAFIFKQSLF